MKEEKENLENVEAEEDTGVEENFMLIKLSKPYKLDGKEITELNMNKLEDLTGADMVAINRMLKRRGNTETSPELSVEFAFFAAMTALGHPFEFFCGLSMKDSMKVKSRVNYFLFS